MIEILQVLCMFAIGVFLIAKPDLVWKIENFLYVKDGSPTQFYFILARSCGGDSDHLFFCVRICRAFWVRREIAGPGDDGEAFAARFALISAAERSVWDEGEFSRTADNRCGNRAENAAGHLVRNFAAFSYLQIPLTEKEMFSVTKPLMEQENISFSAP